MPQLFSPRANTIGLTAIVAVAVIALVAPLAVWAFARSPAATGQYRTFRQPVPFSHALHVNAFGIQCQYCHAGVQRSSMAGLPPTETCIPCHQKITLDSDMFAAVRRSISTGAPIRWQRVTSVPDFVFFNHAVHVRTGIDCATCHGPVQLMQQVYQAAPLTMEWCLQCHRAPERYMSVRAAAWAGWTHGDSDRGRALVAKYDARRLTSCTTCHR